MTEPDTTQHPHNPFASPDESDAGLDKRTPRKAAQGAQKAPQPSGKAKASKR